MYLANDLIQRSRIRQKGPPFWQLFKPHLEKCLTAMFGLQTGKLEAQQKLDILKVVDVWRQRKVYSKDFADRLHRKLVEESGLEHLSAANTHSNKSRIHTNDLK